MASHGMNLRAVEVHSSDALFVHGMQCVIHKVPSTAGVIQDFALWLLQQFPKPWEATVAWLDCTAVGKASGHDPTSSGGRHQQQLPSGVEDGFRSLSACNKLKRHQQNLLMCIGHAEDRKRAQPEASQPSVPLSISQASFDHVCILPEGEGKDIKLWPGRQHG